MIAPVELSSKRLNTNRRKIIVDFVYTMKKPIVLSVRIPERLDRSLDIIADKYHISKSNLVSCVLSSFVLEYSKSTVEGFSPGEVNDEDPEIN